MSTSPYILVKFNKLVKPQTGCTNLNDLFKVRIGSSPAADLIELPTGKDIKWNANGHEGHILIPIKNKDVPKVGDKIFVTYTPTSRKSC